jgi:hypothetical protein
MKTRNISRKFDVVHDLGYKNLIVGGCSFTYNNHDHHSCTWPYYLRDYGNFQNVFDFSMVGGGNTHTFNALIYGLEKDRSIIQDSLIIIQIAGNDRDDYIIDTNEINEYPFKYFYDTSSVVGITGGQGIANFKRKDPIKEIKNMKNFQCRSIENFVKISALNSYFLSLNARSMFFEYRDYNLPGRDQNFDLKKYLPTEIVKRYQSIVSELPLNFYKFCVLNNLLEDDDFHPSIEGHRQWTLHYLLPYLIDNYKNKS